MWFIEGDIAGCLDNISREVLLTILSKKLHDNRFLRLLANLLKAGYLEDWRYNVTLSGTPQGGVVSPILSNVYLDRLDHYVETVLLPAHNRRTERKPPLVAEWGGIPLRWRKDAVLDDQPKRVWNGGTELLQRFLADTCELCGSHEDVRVHHVRALKDLQPFRKGTKPEWVKVMIARRRKTLVVCRGCHEDIHQGHPPRTRESS